MGTYPQGLDKVMMNRLVALSAITIAVLVIGFYTPLPSQSSKGTTSSSTTSASSSVTSTVSTTTTTSVSATSISSTTTGASFTYSPAYPVRVDSVQAITTAAENGDRYLTFKVAFENIGSTPIYVAGGCGSGLNSSIPPNSFIVQKTTGPLCACAEFIMRLDAGQDHTSTTPGCWSGYNYRIVQNGSFTANLTLNWGSGQNLQNSNSTAIVAKFTLG